MYGATAGPASAAGRGPAGRHAPVFQVPDEAGVVPVANDGSYQRDHAPVAGLVELLEVIGLDRHVSNTPEGAAVTSLI
jgi:hypothetical protein